MPPTKPDPDTVMRAIDLYVRNAYDGAGVPLVVQSKLATLRSWKGDFYKAPVWTADDPADPRRYTLRLGNRAYPHMKLIVELAPAGERWLFRTDTHDRHCCPPEGAPEHAEFRRLMDENRHIADAVENAWVGQGLGTFKSYLKEDLDRRRTAGA